MSFLDAQSQHVIERQATVFRLAKKRGISRNVLAADTEIPESTLRSYANGTAMPLHVAVKLMRALPADLASLLIEDSGYRLTPIDQREDDWNGLAGEAAGLASEVCVAQADGQIDHVERARLREKARLLIAKAQAAVA